MFYDLRHWWTRRKVQAQATKLARFDWSRVPAEDRERLTTAPVAMLFAITRAGELLTRIERERGTGFTNNLPLYRVLFQRAYRTEVVKLWKKGRKR